MFNANKDDGIFPVQELAARPNPDPLACRIVEAYMRVQLGTIAMAVFTKKLLATSLRLSKLAFHLLHWIFISCTSNSSCCSTGTSSLCGKSRTSNDAVLYFGQVKLDQPLRRTDT